MNGRERILALLDGQPVDRTPLMPITMMFAADHAGVSYGDYARDHRVLVDAQIATAEAYDFDFVSVISDPAREATDCGAEIQFFDDQPPAIIESDALLTEKNFLRTLTVPDPLGGGLWHGPAAKDRCCPTGWYPSGLWRPLGRRLYERAWHQWHHATGYL